MLINTYNINYILGHEEISPGRKVDPGPAFPLENLRQKLLESRDNDEQTVNLASSNPELKNNVLIEPALVRVPKLNVRSGPNTSL